MRIEDVKEIRPPRHHRTDTHKLTETVVASTKPTQVRARRGPSAEKGSK